MPRYSPNPTGSKRKREPSPEDKKVLVTVIPLGIDSSDAPSQNKRPRCAAALKVEAGIPVKEEEYDAVPIPACSSPTAIKPDPGFRLKLDPDVKVKAKPEQARPPEAGVLKASAQRMPTEQSPTAGPSTAILPRAGQEMDGVRDTALTPSEGPSDAKAKDEDERLRMEAKRVREAKWKQWCEANKWIRQCNPGYKEKAGDVVVHRSDAKAYYRFMDYEIDTLPYVPFDNKHNEKSFGRSYNNASLRLLVSRKLAYLAGLNERPDPEKKAAEFLQAGWKLFEVFVKELEEGMKKKGKTRKPLRLRVVRSRRILN